jgi:flagellar motor switch protein FliN
MRGCKIMATLETVGLDVSVVLGRNRMPIHQLLRMGRGAVIELDAGQDDEVEILANDQPIARGKVIVNGNKIAVEVAELLRRPVAESRPGAFLAQHRSLITGDEQG